MSEEKEPTPPPTVDEKGRIRHPLSPAVWEADRAEAEAQAQPEPTPEPEKEPEQEPDAPSVPRRTKREGKEGSTSA